MSIKGMIAKLKTLTTSPAVRGTMIVSVGIFMGSIFSYLLQIGLGHLLSIEDFGTFNTLLSLQTIFNIPASAVSVALIKKVSELLAQKDFYTLRRLFWNFSKISLGAGFVLSVIFAASNKAVSDYLNITDIRLIFVFALFLTFSYVNISPLSYLQGLLRYKAFSFFNFSSQLLRLIIPLLLVFLGLGVAGVYFGLIAVVLLSFVLALLFLNKNLKMGIHKQDATTEIRLDYLYKQIIVFSVPVLLINMEVALLNNADIIMVKHLFSPLEAGIYAGAITMNKIFLFGAGLVQVVMFPQISHLYASGGNYKKRFWMFLSLQAALIAGGLVIYVIFPHLINLFMFGGKFAMSTQYLPLFAVFTAFYIFVQFLSMFLLAVNKTKAYLVLLPACLLQYISIAHFCSDLYSVVKVNIVASALACFLMSVYVMRSSAHSSLKASSGKITT